MQIFCMKKVLNIQMNLFDTFVSGKALAVVWLVMVKKMLLCGN